MPKAFVMIDAHPGQETESQEAIAKMPGVQFVHQVTGSHDLIAYVDADPYEELAVIVSKIRRLGGVRATDTELVLR